MTLSRTTLLAALIGLPSAPAADPPKDAFGDPLPPGAVLRLGTTRLRHAEVCSLAFTAENKLLSFGRDYVVRTWDPSTGRQVGERAFEKDKIHRHVAGILSPDAKRLAVQYGERVRVLETATGRELAGLAVGNHFEVTARFSPDGTLLAVADREGGRFWVCDAAVNTSRELLKVRSCTPSDFAFTRDNKRLALADYALGVVVWDLPTGRELLRFKPDEFSPITVDFDASGDVLAVLDISEPQKGFQFLRVSTGQAADGWRVPALGDYEWARFAPDGSSLLLGGRSNLQWFDPKGGKDIRTPGACPRRPAFSADGRLVASGSPHAIRVWDTTTRRSVLPANVADAPADEVRGVAVSPDGKTLVTSVSEGGIIRLWDGGGKLTGTIPSNRWSGRYPIFSADGKHLYGIPPNEITPVRWDLPAGKASAQYAFAEAPGQHTYISQFGLSDDSKLLVAITQSNEGLGLPGPGPPDYMRLTTWDAATAKRVESRKVGVARYSYGAMSPDLRWFFWERKVVPLAGGPEYGLDWPEKWQPTQATVSRDGRLVAQAMYEHLKKDVNGKPWYSVEPRGIIVHETATGKRVLSLAADQSAAMEFTRDGRGLVVTDLAGITRWDLATQKPVVRHKAPGPFMGHHGYSFASSLALFPNGNRAITGHIDTTALVWDLTPPARPAKRMSEAELAAAWADLAGDDATKAYTAVWALADAPADAVPFLKKRVRPVVAPTEEAVRKLVGQLDGPAFAGREAAERELKQLGASAAPALRELQKSGLSAEQAKRVERVLEAAAVSVLPAGEKLRQVRALAVLELAGTAEARRLLTELAGGAADDRVTRDAAAAVRRLAVR
jgi:WD40 repeat protein